MFYNFAGFDDRIFVKAFDGREYFVRNITDKKGTADALARINNKISTLITKMEQDNDLSYKLMVQRLKLRYKPQAVSEGSVNRNFTSYTVNKGEKLVFCMRSRDDSDKIYDDNLMFYIALHELAHIASISEGHGDEFKKNFKYLIEQSKKHNLFKHQKVNGDYCGIELEKI